MDEIWKDIKNYEGQYQVSNLGRVKLTKSNMIMKPSNCKDGYLRIGLTKNGKQQHFYVHRLVAKTFIENVDSKLEINHINGIKTDNQLKNLEWLRVWHVAKRELNFKH